MTRRETPPRAWGRPGRLRLAGAAVGNTPTSVGKTTRPCSCASRARKHPHERGEDFPAFSSFSSPAETPPRAWGRPFVSTPEQQYLRNTPTSVGKTDQRRLRRPALWKHPHERGEDRALTPEDAARLETPPRAWGRPLSDRNGWCWLRNTPTSVGKTFHPCVAWVERWKHPHERGEDLLFIGSLLT